VTLLPLPLIASCTQKLNLTLILYGLSHVPPGWPDRPEAPLRRLQVGSPKRDCRSAPRSLTRRSGWPHHDAQFNRTLNPRKRGRFWVLWRDHALREYLTGCSAAGRNLPGSARCPNSALLVRQAPSCISTTLNKGAPFGISVASPSHDAPREYGGMSARITFSVYRLPHHNAPSQSPCPPTAASASRCFISSSKLNRNSDCGPSAHSSDPACGGLHFHHQPHAAAPATAPLERDNFVALVRPLGWDRQKIGI